MGEPEQARNHITRALATAPNDMTTVFTAAEASGAIGDYAKGMDYLERAVRLGYPRREIEANPEFMKWRADPRFQKIVSGVKTTR